MGLKILLWQARRTDDPSRSEERESFAQIAGIPVNSITPFDLLTAFPRIDDLTSYDALMIGGSADYYVSKRNLPNMDIVLSVLREVVALGKPTFATCFGFQLLVEALGGEIVSDPENTQVGTYDLTLTENGRLDPLFHDFPTIFRAQLGRKDKALRLPDNAIHLASSEAIPYQAIRIKDKPIWAVQFHPELTKATNVARFRRYLVGYQAVLEPTAIQKTLSRFDDSPEANELLRRFLAHVFPSGDGE